MDDTYFLRKAIQLALDSIRSGAGGPFGAVVVKDGKPIAEACNRVTSQHDPTAHAEIVAIRQACTRLQHHQLDGCTIYASCEPCPMCLGAIFWARPERLVFASSRDDAASAGFDDAFIYQQIALAPEARAMRTKQLLADEGRAVMREWLAFEQRNKY